MSDNNSLIIKNGSCYINGKLENSDITISEGKIRSIGKADLNNHKVYEYEHYDIHLYLLKNFDNYQITNFHHNKSVS